MGQHTSVRFSVNGQDLEAPAGEMLIAATDRAGIYVPRFCYHPKLSVAANCRMCLVDVAGAPKPMPACALPVAEGMEVETRSDRAIAAQRATMEFLLINHPLDCPVCDQGGECELQDLAMGFGRDISRFSEGKRAVPDPDLGPLVSTDMTRCIHCTRCIRFGEEVAGVQELGATGRSEHMEITTYVQRSLKHELSGNVIDVCPVGALNNKPYRFNARAWEMSAHATVAPHDCVGSALYAHVLRGRVRRIVPRENEAVNETWISDRDRFSCEGLYVQDRLQKPLVRREGRLVETGWEEALEAAAAGLTRVAEERGGQALGALASPSATVEEGSLLMKLMSALGSGNIDHRLRQRDFHRTAAAGPAPWLGARFSDVESLDSLLLVGSDLRSEAPILAHRVRKAAMAGARISYLDLAEREYLHPIRTRSVQHPRDWARALGRLAGRALRGRRRALWLGGLAMRHPAYAELLEAAAEAAAGAVLGHVTQGGNAAGLHLAGVIPGDANGSGAAGLNAGQMSRKALAGMVLMSIEPNLDCLRGAGDAIREADFLLVLNPWASPWLLGNADVVLPIATFLETPGTLVNGQMDWQTFAAAAPPPGLSRPAWKVLRALADRLGLDGFGFADTDQVLADLKQRIERRSAATDSTSRDAAIGSLALDDEDYAGLELPMYSVDGLVRRSAPLQQVAAMRRAA